MSYLPDPGRYSYLDYRRCGRSGLLLPPVSLGLWHNFGAADDFENARQLIHGAFDAGITYFDLANNYGPPPGAAEECFGRIFMQDLSRFRDELVIATKAGHLMWAGPYGDWGSRKHMLSSLDQSLSRMKLDYVDIFYAHRHDPETPLEETAGALVTAVRSGKALYAGISKFPAEQTRQICAMLREAGVPCLVHQLRYNMFNREPEESVFQAIRETGTGCVAFSPLAQGMLTDRYLEGIPADSRAAGSSVFLTEERVREHGEKIRSLAALARGRGQSLAQMALAWVLRDPVVTTALIGASRPQQVMDCLKALENTRFTAEELSIIDGMADR
ncbi:L-glyceraldehyde 3-phosphate reductase [Akkermansia muciniphila]|jgi:L-glyceraldehyde 3-phosphate reductase|uniref:aldo/keto reductase n=1 Tax=Akkermansia muciniphila TaxID=239935 RepID=UPI000C9AAA9D|nr:aldo/keto reductase [Akkermansia muciniphila]PNC41471.1 L-glyceraldehyde 3-phosphate reductase [Akkermansia muciniphila]